MGAPPNEGAPLHNWSKVIFIFAAALRAPPTERRPAAQLEQRYIYFAAAQRAPPAERGPPAQLEQCCIYFAATQRAPPTEKGAPCMRNIILSGIQCMAMGRSPTSFYFILFSYLCVYLFFHYYLNIPFIH